MRCEHEIQTHRYNAYVTLTVNDKTLAGNYSLDHRPYVLFMKALRNRLSRALITVSNEQSYTGREQEQNTTAASRPSSTALLHCSYGDSPHAPGRIAFYMAGEYGEIHGRPHYHALLFGVDFADKKLHGRSKAGEYIYRSQTLEKLWPHGYSSIGEANFNSAAYISRYIMKKRTGDGNKKNYEILDIETGEIWTKKKEYNCMSRNPGIGKAWWDKFKTDVITTDKVITKRGRQLRPPRYYDNQLKRYDKALFEATKHARELEAIAHAAEHTTERLEVQRIVAEQKHANQTRNLE